MSLVLSYKQAIEKLSKSPNSTFQGDIKNPHLITLKFSTNPDVAEEIYSGSYDRARFARNVLHDWFGPAMSTSPINEVGGIKRKIMVPYFTKKYHQPLSKAFFNEFEKQLIVNGGVFHLNKIISYSVYLTMFEEFFGVVMTDEQKVKFKELFVDNYEQPVHEFFQTVSEYFGVTPLWLRKILMGKKGRENYKLKTKRKEYFEELYANVSDRPGSMIEAFKKAEQEGTLTHEEVIAEYFLLASTTNALNICLCWGLIFLDKYPEQQEKVRGSLKYARQAFLETLRLRPSVPTVVYEKASQPSKCPFHFSLPKQTTILFLPELQTNKNYWGEDAHDFKPERFEEGLSSIGKGMFVPFGGSLRKCPSSGLSTHMGTHFLYQMCKKYNFKIEGPNGKLEVPNVRDVTKSVVPNAVCKVTRKTAKQDLLAVLF